MNLSSLPTRNQKAARTLALKHFHHPNLGWSPIGSMPDVKLMKFVYCSVVILLISSVLELGFNNV